MMKMFNRLGPYIGQTVIYNSPEESPVKAAIVIRCHNDHIVDLTILDGGSVREVKFVTFILPHHPKPHHHFATLNDGEARQCEVVAPGITSTIVSSAQIKEGIIKL